MTTTEKTEKAEPLVIKVNDADVDEDQFVSLWNVAVATMDGDTDQARMLASKFLNFLCKQKCEFVVMSPTDAKYLDEMYERDNSLINDWTVESEKVDVVAQHAYVLKSSFLLLLTAKKFSHEKKYNPSKVKRLEWFTEAWKVG